MALQALTYSTRAAVNMRDAAFLGQWKDLDLSQPNERFELIRYYNSRSHSIGNFGYGWCTDFEKKAELLSDKKLRLYDCKLSSPVELEYQWVDSSGRAESNSQLLTVQSSGA